MDKLLELAEGDAALLRAMPIRNAGDHSEWHAIMRLFNAGMAELYWNEETGERGMALPPDGARALATQERGE